MCIYTIKKQEILKKIKNSSKRVRDTTERPKIRRFSGVEDTAKTNKDLGM